MAGHSIIRNVSTRSILKCPLSPGSSKVSAPPKPSRSVRFVDSRSPKASVRRPVWHSLTSYPRSPFPSASLVPSSQYSDRDTGGSLTHRVHASSLELPKRNKKGLTLGPSFLTPVAPTPSPLGRAIFSPSVNEGKKPEPLSLESRLSEAFWEVLSLEEPEDSADEAMVTALEYPPSVDESEIMYADADGTVWSPALPKPGAAVDRIRDSLMSPGNRSSMSSIVRRDFTAPSPNDPFAAFPSFAAAMQISGAITYPSRVAL